MKKLHHLLLAFLLFAMLPAAYMLFQNDNNARKDYEAFLLSEYAKIPQANAASEKLPDMPEMAGVMDYFMTMDPKTKQVPLDRLTKARKATDLAKQRSMDPMPEWTSVPANMGGRARTMMWDPNDPTHNKAWAGSVTGGLWYNDDVSYEESEWIPVESMWASLSISVITYDPNNSQIFYVGTGEAETARIIYRESSGVGVGIYKSLDGGQSWSLLPSTERFKYITDVVVRNENGNSVIYAAAASGIYKGEIQESNTNGLWRSEDGGENWEQVLPMIPGEDMPYAVSDIELGADNKLYVGSAATVDLKGGATIFTSDEGTSGSWTVNETYKFLIEGQSYYKYPERIVLACAPSDENRVYAGVSVGYQDSGDGFIKFQANYFIRSDDKGESWYEVQLPATSPKNWAYLSWHAMAIEVHPLDADFVYAGGLDLYVTPNGGFSWNKVTDWALMYYGGGDDYVHGDQHDIAFNPGEPNEAIFSSDGGIFFTNESNDLSPVFTEANVGFNTLQFYTCALHPEEEIFLGGLQDNGTLRYDGEPLTINSMATGGDGAYCFIDEDTPNNWITTVYYTTIAGWEGQYTMSYNQWSKGTFVNPMDYDDNNDALYGNSCRFNGELADQIYRINGLPREQGISILYLNTGTSVPFSHVKVSPFSDDEVTLFVGSQSGRMFRIENAQSTEYNITEITSNEWPIANISCIAVGGSEDTLLVTFSNYGVNSIWQSTDGGENWQSKEANLPDIPVRWAIYHPEGSAQAMIATETGVWICKNLNEDDAVWEPGGVNYPNVRTDMLQMRTSDNMVLAATHGRGLIYTNWDFDQTVPVDEVAETILNVYPNPATDFIQVDLPENILEATISVYDIQGKKVYSGFQKATSRIDIQSLPAGNYVIRMESDGKMIGSSKLVKK